MAAFWQFLPLGISWAENLKRPINLNRILLMLLNQKRGRKFAGMIALLLFVTGCTSTSANSFCLWANPITVTQEELDKLSEETLRQIDNFNEEYRDRCVR